MINHLRKNFKTFSVYFSFRSYDPVQVSQDTAKHNMPAIQKLSPHGFVAVINIAVLSCSDTDALETLDGTSAFAMTRACSRGSCFQ